MCSHAFLASVPKNDIDCHSLVITQIHRLQEIQCFISMPIFSLMVHQLQSSLLQLPPHWCAKSRLAPLESVLNVAACRITCIPRFSHDSTFMTEQLHWLPLSARIQFKIFFLIYKVYWLCSSLSLQTYYASSIFNV